MALGAEEQRAPSGVVNYGAYSREMVDALTGRSPGRDEGVCRAASSETGGPSEVLGGTLAFYGNKAAWNWGDGMFWAWGEGPDSLPGPSRRRRASTGIVHDLNGFQGRATSCAPTLTQAVWLAVLLVAGVGLLRAPYRRETLLVAASVLGIAAFTLVLQGRSRYLFAFVPLVVVLAAMVHASLPRLGRSATLSAARGRARRAEVDRVGEDGVDRGQGRRVAVAGDLALGRAVPQPAVDVGGGAADLGGAAASARR